jgi:hypothetical protein
MTSRKHRPMTDAQITKCFKDITRGIDHLHPHHDQLAEIFDLMQRKGLEPTVIQEVLGGVMRICKNDIEHGCSLVMMIVNALPDSSNWQVLRRRALPWGQVIDPENERFASQILEMALRKTMASAFMS